MSDTDANSIYVCEKCGEVTDNGFLCKHCEEDEDDED
jgi:hypothetical protein